MNTARTIVIHPNEAITDTTTATTYPDLLSTIDAQVFEVIHAPRLSSLGDNLVLILDEEGGLNGSAVNESATRLYVPIEARSFAKVYGKVMILQEVMGLEGNEYAALPDSITLDQVIDLIKHYEFI